MHLSFITPTKYIKDFQGQGDFVLALSHLMDKDCKNEYCQAIKSLKKPIWLDNGAFETGTPEGIDSLLHKAKVIKAQLVFIPDFFYDAKQTSKAIDIYFYIKNKLGIKGIKAGAIIQADNLKDYLELFEKFWADDRIDVIGINHKTTGMVMQKEKDKPTKKEMWKPKSSLYHKNRMDFLDLIDKKFMKEKPKAVHLLGIEDSYEDVIYAQKYPWVVSNDTSACFWNAVQGKKILVDGSVEGGKTPVKVDFEYTDASEKILKLAQSNINKIKKLMKKV